MNKDKKVRYVNVYVGRQVIYRAPMDLHLSSSRLCFNWLTAFIGNTLEPKRNQLYCSPTETRTRRGIVNTLASKFKKQYEKDSPLYRQIAMNCAVYGTYYADPGNKNPEVRRKIPTKSLFMRFQEHLFKRGYTPDEVYQLADKIQSLVKQLKKNEEEIARLKAINDTVTRSRGTQVRRPDTPTLGTQHTGLTPKLTMDWASLNGI